MSEDKKLKQSELKSRIWYSNALEVLSPMRYHLNRVLECVRYTENGIVHISMSESQLAEIQDAINITEKFFTKKG